MSSIVSKRLDVVSRLCETSIVGTRRGEGQGELVFEVGLESFQGRLLLAGIFEPVRCAGEVSRG